MKFYHVISEKVCSANAILHTQFLLILICFLQIISFETNGQVQIQSPVKDEIIEIDSKGEKVLKASKENGQENLVDGDFFPQGTVW